MAPLVFFLFFFSLFSSSFTLFFLIFIFFFNNVFFFFLKYIKDICNFCIEQKKLFVTVDHFHPCPLLSCAPLNKDFLDTCCFNNSDQHQLLVCDMRIDVPPKSKRKFTPCLKVWKLKDPQTSNHFQEVFHLHLSTSAGVADGATEDIWNNIKTGLLKTTEEVCGTTRPHHWRRETWWWNEHVEKAIAAKRKLSRPGRLVKALGHHTMQPNEMPDMQCTMLVKKPTRSMRILTPNLQKSTALLISLEERTLMLLVTNL